MFDKYINIAKTGKLNDLPIPSERDLFNHLHQLHDIITARHVHVALDQMEKDGVLYSIIPGLANVVNMKDSKKRFKDLWEHTKTVVLQSKPKKEIRWAALFHDFGKPECFSFIGNTPTFHGHELASVKYFKEFSRKTKLFSREEHLKIQFLIANLGYVESYSSTWSESGVRRFAKEIGEHLDDLLLLSRADITTSKKNKRAKIHAKISELKKRIKLVQEKDAIKPVLPKGLGHLIIGLGFKPGPEVGAIMKALEGKVAIGELQPFMEPQYYEQYIKNKIVGLNQ